MKIRPMFLSLVVTLLLLLLGVTTPTTHADSTTPTTFEPTTCSASSGQFAGRIVLDLNHDNLPQANEGVAGITVRLANVHSGTTVLATTTTDAEGCYRFNRSLMVSGQAHMVAWTGMHPSASLIHDPDNGVNPGTPNYRFLTDTANQPVDTDVVYRPNTVQPYVTRCPFAEGTDDIGGMVAIDRNGNNQGDAGEGIQGAIVTLAVSVPGQVVGQATTDANGCYRISRTVSPLVLGDGNGSNGIQGCCNHRSPDMTTYMYVTVSLPSSAGGLIESYDPNGRQTANAFYDVFTNSNGTFESDFLYREANPTAVTVASLNAAPSATPWISIALASVALVGSLAFLFRRRSPVITA